MRKLFGSLLFGAALFLFLFSFPAPAQEHG